MAKRTKKRFVPRMVAATGAVVIPACVLGACDRNNQHMIVLAMQGFDRDASPPPMPSAADAGPGDTAPLDAEPIDASPSATRPVPSASPRPVVPVLAMHAFDRNRDAH